MTTLNSAWAFLASWSFLSSSFCMSSISLLGRKIFKWIIMKIDKVCTYFKLRCKSLGCFLRMTTLVGKVSSPWSLFQHSVSRDKVSWPEISKILSGTGSSFPVRRSTLLSKMFRLKKYEWCWEYIALLLLFYENLLSSWTLIQNTSSVRILFDVSGALLLIILVPYQWCFSWCQQCQIMSWFWKDMMFIKYWISTHSDAKNIYRFLAAFLQDLIFCWRFIISSLYFSIWYWSSAEWISKSNKLNRNPRLDCCYDGSIRFLR